MNEESIEEWLDVSFENFEATSESVLTEPETENASINNLIVPITNSHATTSVTSDKTSSIPHSSHPISPNNSINRSSRPSSPINSATSLSGINNNKHSSLSLSQKSRKKFKSNSADACSRAIEALANSMNQLIIVKITDTNEPSNNNMSDPIVDSCVTFMGQLLKHFKNEILKFEVMNTLVQTIMNPKSQDLETTRHN